MFLRATLHRSMSRRAASSAKFPYKGKRRKGKEICPAAVRRQPPRGPAPRRCCAPICSMLSARSSTLHYVSTIHRNACSSWPAICQLFSADMFSCAFIVPRMTIERRSRLLVLVSTSGRPGHCYLFVILCCEHRCLVNKHRFHL